MQEIYFLTINILKKNCANVLLAFNRFEVYSKYMIDEREEANLYRWVEQNEIDNIKGFLLKCTNEDLKEVIIIAQKAKFDNVVKLASKELEDRQSGKTKKTSGWLIAVIIVAVLIIGAIVYLFIRAA